MHRKIDCPVQLTLPLLFSHDESFRVGIFIYRHFLCAIFTLIAASKVTNYDPEEGNPQGPQVGRRGFFLFLSFSFMFLYRSFIDIRDLKRYKSLYSRKERDREKAGRFISYCVAKAIWERKAIFLNKMIYVCF